MRKSNGVPTITMHVGLGECLAAGAVEMMRIARRQKPAAGAVEIAGNVEAAQQRDRLVVAARRPHLLPVEDRRPLGIDQNVGELLDVARIAYRVVEARYMPGFGMTALAMSISRSSTSRGISRYAGPGAPLNASRTAIEIMSATRSVLGHARWRTW